MYVLIYYIYSNYIVQINLYSHNYYNIKLNVIKIYLKQIHNVLADREQQYTRTVEKSS